MKVDQIRINGLSNPMGAALPYLSLSWQVSETESHGQRRTVIELAEDASFPEIVFRQEGRLNCRGELLDFTPAPRTRYDIRVTVEADRGERGAIRQICDLLYDRDARIGEEKGKEHEVSRDHF